MRLTIDGDPRNLTAAQLQTLVAMAGRGIDNDPGYDAVNVWTSTAEGFAAFNWQRNGQTVIAGGILPDGSSHT